MASKGKTFFEEAFKGKHPKRSIRDDFTVIKRTWPYAKLVFRHQLMIIAISSFVAFIGFVTPFIPKIIIDQGVPAKDISLIINALMLGFVIQLVSLFSNWFLTLYRNQASTYIKFISNSEILERLSKISPKYTSALRSGDIINRMSGVEAGVSFLYGTAETLVRSILQLITLPMVLLAMDYRILMFGIPSIIITVVIWQLSQKTIVRLQQKTVEAMSGASSSLYDVVSAMPELQISNLCARALNQYRKDFAKSWKVSVFNESYSSFVNSFQSQVASITLLALQIYGWNLVIGGQWTIGMMTTIVFALNLIRQPISELLNIRQSASQISIQVRRFLDIYDLKVLNSDGTLVLSFGSHEIVINDLSFSYDGCTNIVSKLSINFQPNQISVITGNSGCGKTTLLKLISGLLEADSGRIAIDGIPIADINGDKWRSQISSIPQNPYFINGSLIDNLKFGYHLDQEFLEKIIDQCALTDVAKRFSEKIVGEGGRLLSSGERQRVAFARSLLQSRPVLLLDEPLSQVDIPTANRILKEVLPLLKTKTCILVTHNPLWMDVADQIYTMFDGKLFPGRRY